jgi:peptide/nickel transport system substrate-binding protein
LDADIDARFKTVGRTQWAVSYWQPNYGTSGSTDPCLDNSGAQSNNCSWAAMLNQQYFRQAIFRAIDQKFIISHVLNGYAVPTWSAIPPVGGSAYVKGVANKLSFSLANAQKLLTSHGWATTTTTLKGVTKYFINADGGSNIATCRWSVGSVAHPNGCGSAAWPIDNGTSATLSLLYPSGDPTTATQVTDEVGMLAKAGIEINATSDTAVNVGNACFAGTAHWELCWYGGWIYAPDYYPSGETLFGTGAGSNNVGYSSAVMDALIAATTQNGNKNLNDVLSSGDAAAYGAAGAAGQSFVSWSATDLPLIWQPQATGFREQLRSLVGAQPPNPLGDSNPEYIKSIR